MWGELDGVEPVLVGRLVVSSSFQGYFMVVDGMSQLGSFVADVC